MPSRCSPMAAIWSPYILWGCLPCRSASLNIASSPTRHSDSPSSLLLSRATTPIRTVNHGCQVGLSHFTCTARADRIEKTSPSSFLPFSESRPMLPISTLLLPPCPDLLLEEVTPEGL